MLEHKTTDATEDSAQEKIELRIKNFLDGLMRRVLNPAGSNTGEQAARPLQVEPRLEANQPGYEAQALSEVRERLASQEIRSVGESTTTPVEGINAVGSAGDKKTTPKKVNFELSARVLTEIKSAFSVAFPKYAQDFAATDIKYSLGLNEITQLDIQAISELLQEKNTLMHESQPMYEILTQELSEKALTAKYGLLGKFLRVLSNAGGWLSYKLDMPVYFGWKKVEAVLTQKFGKLRMEEIVSDMYFGEKENYLKFKQLCLEAGLDFDQHRENVYKKSFFMSRLHRLALNRPSAYKDILMGGLAMPGRVYDIGSTLIPIGGAAVIGVWGFNALVGILFGEFPPAAIPMMMFGAGSIVSPLFVIFHEITHLLGENYRRHQQNHS